jgi:hypothetical protein
MVGTPMSAKIKASAVELIRRGRLTRKLMTRVAGKRMFNRRSMPLCRVSGTPLNRRYRKSE